MLHGACGIGNGVKKGLVSRIVDRAHYGTVEE